MVAMDNARHQAHSGSLRTLLSPQTVSTEGATDDWTCLSQGKGYMIVVYYYSKWIEILHLNDTTTATCIATLKVIFARYGIPTELVSDNAPQFSSAEFTSFAEQYGLTHVTSSPYLANANGEAERAVQTARRILKQDDPWLGLMCYRDTEIAATGCSPAQLVMCRHIRTTLPTMPTTLPPR